MKELPIIFNGPMVLTILDGQKTQTRRVVKPMSSQGWLSPEVLLESPRAKPVLINGEQWAQFAHPYAGKVIDGLKHDEWSPLTCIRCPYGKPGDRLWVRETTAEDCGGSVSFARYTADKAMVRENGNCLAPWWYSRASCPSIHMPRWASRITLEIVSVRVERLQDISEVDAEAEGVLSCTDSLDPDDAGYMPSELFSILWVSINGHESWHANPWVWVVKFKRLEAGDEP